MNSEGKSLIEVDLRENKRRNGNDKRKQLFQEVLLQKSIEIGNSWPGKGSGIERVLSEDGKRNHSILKC